MMMMMMTELRGVDNATRPYILNTVSHQGRRHRADWGRYQVTTHIFTLQLVPGYFWALRRGPAKLCDDSTLATACSATYIFGGYLKLYVMSI